MLIHQHIGHHHGEGTFPHTHLTSVGVDIGSSTTHLMFSELRIGYPSPHQRKPQVLEREIIAKSPILLTPFGEDWNIQAEPLLELIDNTFKLAGLSRDQIDTGAVIITGEAARRDNASRIAELFSDEAGRFVCATAGPRLEAIMAAYGSGAVSKSRDSASTIINIDVGGGTTKLSIIEEGNISDTMAVNIGARLIAYDEFRTVTRLEKAGRRFLDDLGYALEIGDTISEEHCMRLAERMATVLFDLLTTGQITSPDLMITAPFGRFPKVDAVLFSGGVSEYIYDKEHTGFGDLGPVLGNELRSQATARGFSIIEPSEGIRATVIGASQYTVQLTGETIYVPESNQLPLRNLRVFIVHVDWQSPVAERTRRAVKKAIQERDQQVVGAPFVLAFSSPPFIGYGVTQELAHGIDQALAELKLEDLPQLLAFEQNIGRIIGGLLESKWKLPCIDEIRVSELDFLDVGEFVPEQRFVPVVVKSLAFGV